MNTSSHIMSASAPAARPSRLLPILLASTIFASAPLSLFAQTPPERRRGSDDTGGRGERGNFNPQEMQNRMLSAIRERLEVTDDEEWKLISARIARVTELRRATGGPGGPGGFGGFPGRGGPGGPPPGGGDPGRGGPRPGGSPELAALATAVRDKLPDAEIKSRLERLRESRKASEAELAKAQEDLRSILSIRQEAFAVVFGLLP